MTSLNIFAFKAFKGDVIINDLVETTFSEMSF